MGKVFINFSNHPLSGWEEDQIEAARKLGDTLAELPFPPVPPEAGMEEVEKLAQEVVTKILDISKGYTQTIVHIVGEPTLVFAVVTKLKPRGIKCVASTTQRNTVLLADGQKLSEFKFVRFREY